MGAANCCKKPTEIVLNEEIRQYEGEKQNSHDRDSYPQDTEFIQKEENAQDDLFNQKLYEQDSSPQIGGAYEVPIKESSPAQYNQIEEFDDNNIQNLNENQYTPEELAQYNLNNQNINKDEIKDLENINQTGQSVQKPGEPIKYEVQQSNISNISNQQQVDNATLISQRSAAPINLISQVAKSKQMTSIPESNNEELNIPQQSSKLQPMQQEEKEDLNKYFQVPSNIPNALAKTKTTAPSTFNMDDIEKLIQQHQNQQQIKTDNINSVSPTMENVDINKYFKSMTLANQNPVDLNKLLQNNQMINSNTNEVDINKYFQTGIKQDDIINMKDLPETFGSTNINNYIPQQQETTTTTTKITQIENINPNDLKKIEVNVNESLPESFGSNNIQKLGLEQYPETKITTNVSKKTENIDVKDIPQTLTNQQINEIINMKDLPQTFGSNNINNNLKQTTTTTTTTTKTTGNIDLNNLQGNLTNEQINKIIDMKNLPDTFGSNYINNYKKTKTTTITKTSGNIDLNNLQRNLTVSEINNIINMRDLPNTFGSNNMQQTTTSTISKTNENSPIDLKQFGIIQDTSPSVENKDKDINIITNTVQNSVELPTEDYSKYFEQQGDNQTTTPPIDLQQIDISNIVHGSNITFKQPSQDLTSYSNINNYEESQPVVKPTSSTPIVPIGTNINPTSRSAINSSNINLNNSGLYNSQQQTTTTTTAIKTNEIPSGTSYAQSYVLPTNNILNKVNTTKVAQPYVGQNQTLGYSYTMPTTFK